MGRETGNVWGVGWGGVVWERVGLWGCGVMGRIGLWAVHCRVNLRVGCIFHARWLFEMGSAILKVAPFDEETDTDAL